MFDIFQNLKVHLTGDYVVLKLTKRNLSLLKVFVKDMSIEENLGFKCFQVTSLDLLDQGYRGYLEIERRGIFSSSQYLDIESSLKEFLKRKQSRFDGISRDDSCMRLFWSSQSHRNHGMFKSSEELLFCPNEAKYGDTSD